jgi:hypothetical protein
MNLLCVQVCTTHATVSWRCLSASGSATGHWGHCRLTGRTGNNDPAQEYHLCVAYSTIACLPSVRTTLRCSFQVHNIFSCSQVAALQHRLAQHIDNTNRRLSTLERRMGIESVGICKFCLAIQLNTGSSTQYYTILYNTTRDLAVAAAII